MLTLALTWSSPFPSSATNIRLPKILGSIIGVTYWPRLTRGAIEVAISSLKNALPQKLDEFHQFMMMGFMKLQDRLSPRCVHPVSYTEKLDDPMKKKKKEVDSEVNGVKAGWTDEVVYQQTTLYLKET